MNSTTAHGAQRQRIKNLARKAFNKRAHSCTFATFHKAYRKARLSVRHNQHIANIDAMKPGNTTTFDENNAAR